MARRKIRSWKEGGPTPLQQAHQGTVLFWGETTKLCEMWILLEKHRAEFWVCYLLQAVVQLVADLTWSGLKKKFHNLWLRHFLSSNAFLSFPKELSQALTFPNLSLFLAFDILDLYFMPEPKTLTSLSKQNSGPLICFDGLVLILAISRLFATTFNRISLFSLVV